MTRRKKKPQSQIQNNNHLQLLMSNLNPIPFLPLKTLDFSTHHILLLKRLGLWDFANLDFNRLASTLRADLIAQLIASFDPENRCSVVDGATIPVSCAALARALKLPGKYEGMGLGMGMVTKESIRFVVDFVFNWMVLRDDETWIIPKAVSECVDAVEEGRFEDVDWAALVWFMVERELISGRELRNCFYATHMMCLIEVPSEEDGEISSELSNSNAYEAMIEAQRAVIREQDAVIEAKQGVIEKQKKRIDSYKARIEELEKEHGLMVNLLEGYREALKRNQMAFSEFRESCQCKHLHEPIYKDVPGASGLVLSVRGLKL